MSNPDQTTAPTLETLTELVQVFQQSVMARLDHIETAFGTQLHDLNDKVDDLNDKVESLRLQAVGLDVRQDRLRSQFLDMRADIKIMREEIHAWAKDTLALKRDVEFLPR